MPTQYPSPTVETLISLQNKKQTVATAASEETWWSPSPDPGAFITAPLGNSILVALCWSISNCCYSGPTLWYPSCNHCQLLNGLHFFLSEEVHATESILSPTMEDCKAALTQLHNRFTWLKSISLCIINLTENLGVTKTLLKWEFWHTSLAYKA